MRTLQAIGIVMFFLTCGHAGGQTTPLSSATNSREELFLKRMPLRKKIGQLFIVGFQGQKLEDGLGETLTSLSPGGVIIFGRNMSSARQITDLNFSAQKAALKASRLPLLIATDQEGGDVIRIKTAMPLPSALALGKSGRPEIAKSAGFATGVLMKTLGFNMNFAPVLDVADSKQPMFIGTRTFGDDPSIVAEMGERFSAGLIAAGVMPTGKHFPGHGGIAEDSHVSLPVKNLTLDELRATDLVPFARMQNRFADRWAAMLAHVSYPKIDPSGAPATLSKKIVTGILREELAFNGIVVTDDIEMAGAGRISSRERVIRALEAGADMIVVAWNKKLQHDLVNAVEKAVRTGRISKNRIDQSLRRIIAAKRTFAVPRKTVASDKELRLALLNPAFAEVGEATIQARLKRPLEQEEIELKSFATGKKILVFSANEGFSRSFKSALRGQDVRSFKLDVDRPYDIDKILRSNPGSVGVFYASGYQASRVAAKVSDDVARQMLLVTVETRGIQKNAASFRYVAGIYFRHPKLGKMIAEKYFTTLDPIRSPAKAPH